MMTPDAIRRRSGVRKEAQAAQQTPAWQRPLPQAAPQELSEAQKQAQQRPRVGLAGALSLSAQKTAQGQGSQGSGGQGQLSKPTDRSYYIPVSTGEIAPPKKAQKRGMSM